MPVTNDVVHVEEIEHATRGGRSNRDSQVVASWKRCIETHGLDPTRQQQAYIVPNPELREHQERIDKLIRTARFGLESLYHQVAGLGYVLLLSDADGIIVDFIGDPALEGHLKKTGLYLGAYWKEEFAGTCAVGSCLAMQEPVIVHQTDHFDATHTALTCTAAPIHDVNGRIAAVLDISALSSPLEKESQFLALQLVNSCRQRIEMASLLNAFRFNWIVEFSQSHEFLGVESNCAVALDAQGNIAGFTNDAQKVLAQQIGIDWRDTEHLLGRGFDVFFDFDVNHLGKLTRAIPSEDKLIDTCSGLALFANAIAPQQRPVPTIARKTLPAALKELAGDDPVMADIIKKSARLAESQISILLLGETGTGKERLAAAIHRSRRRTGEFVAVNCAALPESLIESELFGYVPGAFTGALAKGKKGLIQQANGGTLFLDEIGDMPLALQARFLRVLAEREVMPVGSERTIPVSVRVIAATHKNLPDLIKTGAFREDLYYRLNGAVLSLPPLRLRQDFDWLLDRIVSAATPKSRTMHFNKQAYWFLHRYNWPGNIRELVNTVEYAVAVSDSDIMGMDDLPGLLVAANENNSLPTIHNYSGSDEQSANLTDALLAHRWNISATARFLGIDRATVHRRMNRLNIVPPNKRNHD